MTGHLPPQDLEAEEAVLGAMIQSRRALTTVMGMGLRAEDFYRPKHQQVFEAVVKVGEGDQVDELTVVAELKSTGVLDEAFGVVDVMGLAERCPTAANAEAYAQSVMDHATKRRVVDAGHRIASTGYDPQIPARDAVAASETILWGEVGNHTNRGSESSRGRFSVSEYEAEYARDRSPEGHPGWALPLVSELIGFLRPSEVLVGAALTSVGKTWLFGLDALAALCDQGAHVLYCSTEMRKVELADRLVAMGGFRKEKVDKRDIEPSLIRPRLEQIDGWKWTALVGTITPDMIRSECSRARMAGEPYDVVIGDYFQDFEFTPRKGESNTNTIDRALKDLRLGALDMGHALILLSQLNEVRPRKIGDKLVEHPPPTMADLRDTRKLAQVANHLLFLHRDRIGHRYAKTGIVIPAKTRSLGDVSPLRVEWNGTPDGDRPYRFVKATQRKVDPKDPALFGEQTEVV